MSQESHRKGTRLITSSMWLSIISLAQLLVGLVARTIYAGIFGTSREMDVFLLVIGVVSWFNSIVVVAANKGLIPSFIEVREKQGERDAWRMASTVINGLGIFSMAIIAVGWILAPYIVPVIGPGLEPKARLLATGLLRLAIPILLTNLFTGILMAFLFSYEDFVLPKALRLVGSGITIGAVLILSPYIHIYSMAVGMLADGVITSAILAIRTRMKGLLYNPFCLDFKNQSVLRFLRTTLPLMGAALFSRAQNVVDRFFASFLRVGSISFLNYASVLVMIPNRLLASGIQVIFPRYSRLAAQGDLEGMKRDLTRCIALALFFGLPALVALLCLGKPAIMVLFQHGRFDAESTKGTWTVLPFYLGLLIIGFPSSFLSYGLYALQETKVILWISLWDFLANAVFNYFFMLWLGCKGIAMATSVVLTVDAALLLFFIQRRIGLLNYRYIISAAFSASIASAGMAVIILILQKYMPILPSKHFEISSLTKLMTQAVIGIIVYSALSIALGSKEGWYLFRWAKGEAGRALTNLRAIKACLLP